MSVRWSERCERWPVWVLAVVLWMALLPGCRDFAEHRGSMASLHARGQYEVAAKVLDEKRKDYGRKNEVLWKLDRGATALALGDDATAIALLNEAEDEIERKRERSRGETIGQWVFNDTAAAYVAEPYEDLYLNVIKMAAQLQAGRIEGGATVESLLDWTRALRASAWEPVRVLDFQASKS